jgi:hypothetical protein
MLHSDAGERAILKGRLQGKLEISDGASEPEHAAAKVVSDAFGKLSEHVNAAEAVRTDKRLSPIGVREKLVDLGKAAAADLSKTTAALEALEAQHRAAVADYVERARKQTVPALDPAEASEIRQWLLTVPHEQRTLIYSQNPKAAAAALGDVTGRLIATDQFRALVERDFFERQASPSLRSEREALARQARVLDAARFKLSDAKAAAGLLA